MARRLPLATAAVAALAGAPARAEPPPPPEAASAPASAPEVDTVGEEVIVVTGTRADTPLDATPVVTEVIDRARIEESGAETVAEALALRPGLWLDRGIAGTGISIQGLGPEYVLVLVDGQRQIGRTDGALDLERLGVADVERIEIVRGPSSALYGADALGGVVHIVTREPEDGVTARALARIDGRLATDLAAALGFGAAGWAAGVTGEWRRGDAFDRTPDEPSTTIAAYEDARFGLRGARRAGDRWRVDVAGDYLRRDLRGVDATAAGAVLDRRNLIEIGTARAGARWIGERTIVRGSAGLGVYRDQYASDQRGAAQLDAYQVTDERLVEATAQVEHARGRHRGIVGAEVLREALDADRLQMPGERWRLAVFVQDEWRPDEAGRWTVVPAARVDHDTQFGTHATPRLAARWDPADDVVARGSVGAGYRAPGFKELLLRFENPGAGYVVEGNPDLRPESSISGQLGGEWRPRAWAWLAVGAFHNELDDLITAVTVDDGGGGPLRFSYGNVARARTHGVEANVVLGRGRLAVEVGWAYTRARDLERSRALEGIPAHRVATAIRWRDRDEDLDATIELAVTGPRPFYLSEDPSAATWTDPRAELRARIARRFDDRVRFFLGGDNLLDAGDDTFDPLAPRTLYVGVEARH